MRSGEGGRCMRTDRPPAIIRAFKQTLPSNDHYRHPNDDHAQHFYSEIEGTFLFWALPLISL